MIETHKSFTNTWECDENGHMNVQFYYKRFEEAAKVFDALAGITSTAKLTSRHVRYHRELHSGDSTQIISGQIADGPHRGKIAHLLTNSISGALCATALDSRSTTENSFALTSQNEVLDALPRGLSDSALEPVNAESLLTGGKAIVSNYSIVGENELDETGHLISSRVISRFTDGAPHVWEHSGVTTQWLNSNGNGRVAVEMKLCPIAAVKRGAALRLVSFLTETNGKTMQLVHQLEEIEAGKTIFMGSVICLVMNLTSRRSVPLPPSVRSVG